MQVFQSTLKRSIRLEGIGVHSGAKTVLTLCPAAENHGIVFIRRDSAGRAWRIPALAAHSLPSALATVLTAAARSGAELQADKSLRVETIEHLMAALAAGGVDNALAELSVSEAPILDGSAAPYMEAIAEAGLKRQQARRLYLHIIKPVRAETASGGGFAEFRPLAAGEKPAQLFDVEIAFAAQAIGRQHLAFALSRSYFTEHLAAARTFGFLAEAEKLRAQGLARGASMENSIALDENGAALNPEKLIAPDGFVRHKALDAVGDTALLGRPFIGLFRSFKSGHKLNAAAVCALLADKSAYEIRAAG